MTPPTGVAPDVITMTRQERREELVAEIGFLDGLIATCDAAAWPTPPHPGTALGSVRVRLHERRMDLLRRVSILRTL